MADGVVLDLYAEDLDKDFPPQSQDEFCGDGVDLYDDIGGPNESTVGGSSAAASVTGDGSNAGGSDGTGNGSNGVYHQGGGSLTPNQAGRRFQLYIGNLTWWTTDHDISSAMRDIGITDFQEVKFFENRSNGQSKGFCVISLGSEPSLRMVLERLPKKELHGQAPVVTYPTKQALNQFESLQKTRPVPPAQTNGPPRGPAPPNMNVGGPLPPHPGPQGVPPGHPSRMINPNMPPGQYRPQHMPQGPPGGPNAGPPRMQFQGPPGGMPMRGPRPDWNRPPMGGFPPQGPPGGPPQGPPHMQGPPRGPAPPNMGGPMPPPGGPSPHVNPAFFNQPGGPPMGGPPHGPPGAPQQSMGMPPQHGPPPHFAQQGAPRGPWPGPPQAKPGPYSEQPMGPQLSEVEFEEIMGRNRTVSSSAIARAVSDAAAGEYASAIETLVTAISLIKQSKVAQDERCKILISSLQDTLHGIETKSYNRRERSRSRERSHRIRPRRERSSSRYRERSREREREGDRRKRDRSRERHRESKERDVGYRERSRSRERERQVPDHYRDDSSSRSARPRKSPEQVVEASGEAPTKRGYYEERYRSSDRDRDRDRERERDRREEHRSRH
ncbi:cleavage and polyadenylation specificity factor subunit 6 isoform X2 [Teleopsis dalmanni]|uniref:cleavage and polyadenylation specificity factor subunit 6 isoform X2 n=1 Tax=Teleopsis dalmanni TaxID=139649 RepID=UPI0018CDD947|nr:cleavage and polyadenylation specificity factor subunit 6 isoform X2 [Teleopsis dalmanni]